MLLAISVKLLGAKPTVKPSPTSKPQPGPGVAVGIGLAVGVGVGVSSPAGTAGALARSRTLEYGNLGSCDRFNGARMTVRLLELRRASAKGIAQMAIRSSR